VNAARLPAYDPVSPSGFGAVERLGASDYIVNREGYPMRLPFIIHNVIEFIAHAVSGSVRMQALIAYLLALSRVGAMPRQTFCMRLAASIQEVFPLICPHCSGPMRIIAIITSLPSQFV